MIKNNVVWNVKDLHYKLSQKTLKLYKTNKSSNTSWNVNDGILVRSPELLFDYTKLEIYKNNICKNHFL